MPFQDDPSAIRWRLHLASAPDAVYNLLDTNAGRSRFWAESAIETEGVIHFIFPNGLEWYGPIIERTSAHRFTVVYIGGSTTSFDLAPNPTGGTDLTLIDAGVPAWDREEVIAGWVSVLMTLKAAADFHIDLRNHDPSRTWEDGFVEN